MCILCEISNAVVSSLALNYSPNDVDFENVKRLNVVLEQRVEQWQYKIIKNAVENIRSSQMLSDKDQYYAWMIAEILDYHETLKQPK